MDTTTKNLIDDLTVWRSSGVRIVQIDPMPSGNPCIEFKGQVGPIVEFKELPHVVDYDLQLRAAAEPEYVEAARKLNDAIQGIKDARMAIIERKAWELALSVVSMVVK